MCAGSWRNVIKSIKASSDCLCLRLPFPFSRAAGTCSNSERSSLHVWEGICARQCASDTCTDLEYYVVVDLSLISRKKQNKLTMLAGMIVLVQF